MQQEEDLFCPKFVLKSIFKGSINCNIKLYYSSDLLMSDTLALMNSYDLIIQPFIRQRHMTKPTIYQYHMKNGTVVHKANCIVNKHEVTKFTTFY